MDEEELEDIRDYNAAKAELERGEGELISAEVVFAILDGENPVKVWREFRGLTQQRLADAAGISKPYLSQIETGKHKGSADILSALTKALNVTLEEALARGAE
jgi:DNA-binding XRE family transcriptional regulator